MEHAVLPFDARVAATVVRVLHAALALDVSRLRSFCTSMPDPRREGRRTARSGQLSRGCRPSASTGWPLWKSIAVAAENSPPSNSRSKRSRTGSCARAGVNAVLRHNCGTSPSSSSRWISHRLMRMAKRSAQPDRRLPLFFQATLDAPLPSLERRRIVNRSSARCARPTRTRDACGGRTAGVACCRWVTDLARRGT